MDELDIFHRSVMRMHLLLTVRQWDPSEDKRIRGFLDRVKANIKSQLFKKEQNWNPQALVDVFSNFTLNPGIMQEVQNYQCRMMELLDSIDHSLLELMRLQD